MYVKGSGSENRIPGPWLTASEKFLQFVDPPSPEELRRRQQESQEYRRREEERRDRLARRRARLRSLPPLYVITMVHGTFARRSAWIRPLSPFSNSLREDLQFRAKFRPCVWSGRNTASERAAGAQRLRAHVARLKKRFPGAVQVIIAHSHGGNIALWALDTEDAARNVLVVTLGTPFLSARLAPSQSPMDIVTGAFAALATGFSVVLAGAALGHGWRWWWIGVMVAGIAGALLLLGRWLARGMRARAESFVSDMPETAVSADQLLIIRHGGDEASGALNGARVAAALVDLGWRRLSAPVFGWLGRTLKKIDYFWIRAISRKIDRELAKYPVKLESADWRMYRQGVPGPNQKSLRSALLREVLVALAMLTPFIVEQLQTPIAGAIIGSLAFVYAIPALLVLILTALSLPFAAGFVIALAMCGWDLVLAGPCLNVTAETSPIGKWRVRQMDSRSRGTLSHSGQEEADVMIASADWIREVSKGMLLETIRVRRRVRAAECPCADPVPEPAD